MQSKLKGRPSKKEVSPSLNKEQGLVESTEAGLLCLALSHRGVVCHLAETRASFRSKLRVSWQTRTHKGLHQFLLEEKYQFLLLKGCLMISNRDRKKEKSL